MRRRTENMDPRNEEPFDRESWRRLLAADAGAPSKDTDRVILAEARRALTPRSRRWWLPASLAASLLLAVLLVQWQLEDSSAPALVTESDVLPTPTPSVMNGEASGAMSSVEAVRRDAEAGAVAPPPPSAGVEQAADAATPAQAESARDPVKFQARKESVAARRNPEEWYAEIEALRAAGRVEEADAELARLEAAWPGWLSSHKQEKQ